MFFNRSLPTPTHPSSITTLASCDLDIWSCPHILGVWLDCKLSFQTHIKHLQSKIKSRNRLPISQQSILHLCCQTYPSKRDYPTDPWLWRCHLHNRLHPICWVECWRLSQCHPFFHQNPIYYPPLRPVCSRWLALASYPSPNPLAPGHL
jgi:hypothetical protein